jgi:hypothetical protein
MITSMRTRILSLIVMFILLCAVGASYERVLLDFADVMLRFRMSGKAISQSKIRYRGLLKIVVVYVASMFNDIYSSV